MGFADDVGKSIERVQEQLNTKINAIAQELFTLTVKNTPVGTWATKGRLINNWYIGLGVGKYNRTYSPFSNTAGTSSYAQVSYLTGTKEFLGKDGEVSFTNSTPYGYRAEYFGWNFLEEEPRWRGSKPYAMIANSLTATAAKYKK